MKSITVSFRIPKEVDQELKRMTEVMDVEKSGVLRRLVIAGVEGLKKYEESGEPFNWPRAGRISMTVQPDESLTDLERRQILEDTVDEVLKGRISKGGYKT